MASAINQIKSNHVDLQKIRSIEKNRVISFFNHFSSTVLNQLNEINNATDSRLYTLNSTLNRCEANLKKLEIKLNSIPGLTIADDRIFSPPTKKSIEVQQSVGDVNKNGVKIEPTIEAKSEPEIEEPAAPESTEESEVDDLTAKYEKMIKMGIPVGAVKQKMLMEGIDPNLLKSS